MEPAIEIRRLDRAELVRVGEIDRTEHIEVLYDQRGTELVARRGEWDAAAWDPEGHDEHSVEAQVRALEHHVDAGGTALGAFRGEDDVPVAAWRRGGRHASTASPGFARQRSAQLVGIGAVVPHLRPGIAQLAYLHVSAPWSASGIGGLLSAQLEQIARAAGDAAMVVTATPTENTVRFYLGRGFRPMAEPLAELFALEPEDVHLRKVL